MVSDIWNCLLHIRLFEENVFTQSPLNASSNELMNKTKELLVKQNFKMKDLAPISWFLGIQFKQNNDRIDPSQSQ